MNAILIVEIFVTLIVVVIQCYYFDRTRLKIIELGNTFPIKSLEEENIQLFEKGNEAVEVIAIEDNKYSIEFVDIVNSINKYLVTNKGAIDFNIIKSIVDRNIESHEEDVTSNISLPLYIGLMGTFIGIILGLVKISFFGGVTEPNINSFLGGIFIAMIASLFGLMLTVVNNSNNFKRAKKLNDRRKNAFFDFLQIQLLPHIGNSIYDVFNRFKNNISEFNYKFSENISKFDENFTQNISNLKEAVTSLSTNINPVIDNIKTQKEFLKELRAIGYNRMAEANLKVFQVMNEAGPNFVKFIQKQKELNDSIDKTVQIVSIVDSVLNRVSKFEEGINALGDRINNADYMGSDLLAKVNRRLSELDDQFELLKQHSQNTKGQIEDHFNKETKKIDNLSQRVLNDLQLVFEFETDKNPFAKLKLLDTVTEQLDQILKRTNSNGEVKQLVRDLETTKTLVQEIKENALVAFNERKKGNRQRTSEELNSFETEKKRPIWRRLNPFKRKKKQTSGSKA